MAKIINTSTLDPRSLNPDENHWVYNGLDCCVTKEILDALRPLTDNTSGSTYNFSKELQAPVLEMMLRGLLVNQNKRQTVLRDFRQKKLQLLAQLDEIVREGVGVDPINPGSPLQVMNLLYGVMGLPVQKKRKADGSYGPSADRDALEKLQVYYIAEPIISHILAIRDLAKSIGFLETGIDDDGRMRTSIQIAGTNTGRFSSSESDYETGTNLQNVTESLRSVFVADPGYKFCNLDLEQGDSRNVGALCWNLLVENPEWNEKTAGAYLDACESGDLHTTVAKMAMPHLPWGEGGRTDREVAETRFYRHHDYRFMCKKAGHGSNYLGTARTIASQTKFPISNIQTFQTNYFNAFPCIPAWHHSVFYQLEHFANITTPFGRRRYFFGRNKDAATRREAVAFAPQSMTAEEINLGILRLWRANRVQLLMQVHDSILFQYPEELEDEIVPWATKLLVTHLALAKGRDFFIPTEAKIGWNWGNYSEDNPDGLMKYKGHDKRQRLETKFKLSLIGM